ncbi:MAG: ATP-dependent Clp protease proteolytic subunit [Candidatus Fibromonas sp.]|jgi:membrane-bound serine protease (ClpP class)|nr:ATP-dependent Clp protease proteolytic subunit [Candidatus Fibromonas sp.]
MFRFLFLTLISLAFANSAEGGKTAAWIILEGDVDPGMSDYAKRAIAEAVAKKPDLIVFEVNTFGGRLDAAFEIVDTITALKIPTVALVQKKAISAGALIALSSDKLYMLPSTTIGDCAPIVQSSDGQPQIVGEKIQSPLRAKFRNLAERNGHPRLLSEAFVSPDLGVIELSNADTLIYMNVAEYNDMPEEEQKKWTGKKTLVRAGELLTMTNEEALLLKFSKGTPENIEEFKKELNITKTEIIKISWAENLTRFIGTISGVLMILGFGLLYMEFKTPGFGAFGIIGIVLIATVFLGQYASSLHDKLPLVLLCLGVGFMLLEIFVLPGLMICGALGIICFVAALAMSFDVSSLPAFAPSFEFLSNWQYGLLYIMLCALLALSLPILASKYLIPMLPEGFTPINKTDLSKAHSPVEEFVEEIKKGDIGVALTDLRPSGHVRFGDKMLDAQSRSDFIEAGSAVKVDFVEAGKVWVISILTAPPT